MRTTQTETPWTETPRQRPLSTEIPGQRPPTETPEQRPLGGRPPEGTWDHAQRPSFPERTWDREPGRKWHHTETPLWTEWLTCKLLPSPKLLLQGVTKPLMEHILLRLKWFFENRFCQRSLVATKILAVVALEQSLLCTRQSKQPLWSIVGVKPRVDITKSAKQGWQWPKKEQMTCHNIKVRIKVQTWDEDRAPVNELSIPGMTNKPIQDGNARDPVGRLDQQQCCPQTCGAIYERLMTQ